jgi:hypothetical protein
MNDYIKKALVILRNSSRMSKDFAIEHNTDLHKGMYAAFETSIGVIEEAIAERETWQDISTAPRDGTEIAIFIDGIYYQDERELCPNGSGCYYSSGCTETKIKEVKAASFHDGHWVTGDGFVLLLGDEAVKVWHSLPKPPE